MPNENCLIGMKCPECGSEGPFKISVRAWATVHDDGTDEDEAVEWDDDSACICKEYGCSFRGKVRDFKEEKDAEGTDGGETPDHHGGPGAPT